MFFKISAAVAISVAGAFIVGQYLRLSLVVSIPSIQTKVRRRETKKGGKVLQCTLKLWGCCELTLIFIDNSRNGPFISFIGIFFKAEGMRLF